MRASFLRSVIVFFFHRARVLNGLNPKPKVCWVCEFKENSISKQRDHGFGGSEDLEFGTLSMQFMTLSEEKNVQGIDGQFQKCWVWSSNPGVGILGLSVGSFIPQVGLGGLKFVGFKPEVGYLGLLFGLLRVL